MEAFGYIREEGGKYCVYSEEGKKLGCYDTEEQALKRLRQIEHYKREGMIICHASVQPHNVPEYKERGQASEADRITNLRNNIVGEISE